LLSRLAGCIAECRVRWFKNAFTAWFAKRYQVDMSEALVEDLTAYEHFNAFFTRALKTARARWTRPRRHPLPGRRRGQPARPDRAWPHLPGQGPQLQRPGAAGRRPGPGRPFMGGEFATIYLSPKDYHRVHMPLAGTLREMVYVPGRLFSVNQTTAENVPSCSPATSVWSACSTPSVGRWPWCWLAR
jgi:phosphatidylserine decarboxylase